MSTMKVENHFMNHFYLKLEHEAIKLGLPVFYRYSSFLHDNKVHFILDRYFGIKRTYRGWWVVPSYIFESWKTKVRRDEGIDNFQETHVFKNSKRFILDGEGKRYAYKSKLSALHSFRVRQERRLMYAENTLKAAQTSLAMIKSNEILLVDGGGGESTVCGSDIKVDGVEFYINYD